MNSLKYILGIIACLSMSCSDFLDRQPLDQISSTTFWKNKTDADLALAGMYTRMHSGTYNYNSIAYDCLADDVMNSDNWGDQYVLGNYQPTDGTCAGVFNESYVGIASCNFLLDNIINIPDLSEKDLNYYKSQALFMRAFFYFHLTEFYGGVPFYLKNLVTVEESKVKQTSKQDIVNHILGDLDFAIENLDDVSYNGYAVRGTALALKAKILLFNERWAEASVVAKRVIDSKIFSICDDYVSLFCKDSYQNGNPEILFSTRYALPDITTGVEIGITWFGVFDPSQSLVDEYEYLDGKASSDKTSIYYKADATVFEGKDPRLSYNVKSDTVPWKRDDGFKWVNFNYATKTGYKCVKHANVARIPCDWSTLSDQDWIHLRYADVLLIYAEAENEANGPSKPVEDAINEIRARKSVNMPPVALVGLTKDDARLKIRHERRVELAMENKRYFDLRRWKLLEVIIPTLKMPNGTPRKFDPSKNYVFPFYVNELNLNPNLDQNPGYDK